MSIPPEGPINPYAPPEAALGGAPEASTLELAEAEATRRKYLSHEASVQSVGSLHLLGAVLSLIGLAVGVTLFSDPRTAGAAVPQVITYLVLFALNLGVGIGLRRLQTWARWLETALVGLSCAFLLFGIAAVIVVSGMTGGNPAVVAVVFGYGFALLIMGYILFLLVSPRGSVVFSPEYKEVIARTPHIKYRTSCVLKFLLLLVVALIALAVVGALMRSRV